MALTSKITFLHKEIRDRLEGPGIGSIYAFWHGRQAFLVRLHQNDQIHPLVSQSRDGELIARVCRAFGIEAIRGSSSRGGAEALLGLREVLAKGERVGVTPDGPRGPLHSVHPGVLFLAQKTGAPIVPVAYGAKSSWVFGSWDRFLIPKPFNHIVMSYGAPLHISPQADLEQEAVRLREALKAVTDEADHAAGARRL